jgi:uncharacterized repeat protein (TIGR03803 family)
MPSHRTNSYDTQTEWLSLRVAMSAYLQRFRWHFALLLVAGFVLHGYPMSAQTVRALGGSSDQPLYGVMQATDGNFYSSSTYPLTDSCPDSDDNECSGISKITPSGVVTTFHLFESNPSGSPDGQLPNPIIEAPDGNFYGTARQGGAGQAGTFFRITKAGVFTVLYSFNVDPASGSRPGTIIMGQDGAFYGLTEFGGVNQVKQPDGTFRQDAIGTLFRVTADGTFTVLHTFSQAEGVGNTVAAFPAGLVQGVDGSFYGAGISNYDLNQDGNNQAPAVLYKVDQNGKITIMHTFALDGSEGTGLYGPLTVGPDGNFYGVALSSAPITGNGVYGNKLGVIFKMSSTGAFQRLYTLPANGASGIQMDQNLTLGGDGNLYGTVKFGGTNPACTYSTGCGDIFRITPDGTFTVLYDFTGNSADSGFPAGPLLQINNGSFVGTAFTNTVYNLTLTPAVPAPVQLTLVPVTAANQAITLTWKVLNAFSANMQQCHAAVLSTTGSTAGAGTWSGPQTGKMDGLVYTGSATITPTLEGTYTYELSCGGVEVGSATLVVGDAPTITTTSLPNATVLKDYNALIQATGGILPYSFGYSGTFPAGLKIDPNTGFMSGQATQFGVYQITFGVQDSSKTPQIATKTIQLTIDSGLSLIGALANGKVGAAYSAVATATGGVSPYKWALVSGKLPDGLALNPKNGAITGTPTVADKFTFALMVTDSEGNPATFTQPYTISTVVPPLVITEGSFPDCTVNVVCEGQFVATGGKPPYTWAIAPGHTFPAGLTLDSDGGFTGKPTQYSVTGDYELAVQVTDSEDPPAKDANFNTLKVVSGLKIVSIPLPTATVGVAYQAPAPTATGGIPPYTWKINAGLNPQLTKEYGSDPTIGALYSSGPVTPGTFTLFYTAYDSEGMPANIEMDATLIVNLPAVTSVTTLSSSNINAGTGMNVTLTSKVSSVGGTPSGVVTFYNGSTSIGTATLDATQTATLTTTFSAAGVYQLTASYAGAGPITGSVSAPLTETIVTPTVSASFNPGTLTLSPGASGTLTLTLTPTAGYTGMVALSCGSLPAHVSCTFSPQSLTIAAGMTSVTDTLTIRTSDAATALLSQPERHSDRSILLGIGIFPTILIFGATWRRQKRALSSLSVLCLLCLSLGILSGCGSSSGGIAKAGTYTVQVSIQVANGQVQTVPLSLIVQ